MRRVRVASYPGMNIRLKHRIEYAVLRGVCGLVCWLPYRVTLCIAYGIARLMHDVIRFRVREARRRIRQVAGPDISDREVRRIAWLSMRNLAFNAVEIMCMAKVNAAWLEKRVTVNGVPFVGQSFGQPGHGAILTVPHMGNWDLSGVGAHILGVPTFFLARRQKNPLTDAWLMKMRGVTGIETVYSDHHALRQIITNLKAGKVFCLLPDVRARGAGIHVRFLGEEAYLATGVESFARHAGVPIYPATARRHGWARQEWTVFPPVRPDPAANREEDKQRMMQEVMDLFDREIRKDLSQYFWYNKRWVLDPVDTQPPRGAHA
jgi:Kdo2-lipid IVA lauroyltransferase/acyltransferase